MHYRHGCHRNCYHVYFSHCKGLTLCVCRFNSCNSNLMDTERKFRLCDNCSAHLCSGCFVFFWGTILSTSGADRHRCSWIPSSWRDADMWILRRSKEAIGTKSKETKEHSISILIFPEISDYFVLLWSKTDLKTDHNWCHKETQSWQTTLKEHLRWRNPRPNKTNNLKVT